MSTVQPELVAVQALRDHLLAQLPAKVTAVNLTRAAVLKAARAGDYTIPSGAVLRVGTVDGTATNVPLTSGLRSTPQIVAEIGGAISGVSPSTDSVGRLVLTRSATPTAGTPSVLYLAPDSDGSGVNAAFGWSASGHTLVRNALVAPGYEAVVDGEPGLQPNLADSFLVLLKGRTVDPREGGANRSDVHRVRIAMEVLAAEQNVGGIQEFIGSAVRAVREVVYEDRTLGNAVYLAELPQVVHAGTSFQFVQGPVGVLFASAQVTALIHVFERS